MTTAPAKTMTTPAAKPASTSSPLATVTSFFTGIVGKLEAAFTMSSSGSSIVTGVVTSLSDIPALVADITRLVADVETGKWTAAPADLVALIEAFDAIAAKYGLNLSALTAFVSELPFTPAVAKAA